MPKPPKILTQMGTVPISYKKGRRKPFRLRVNIGGKRREQYFTTRADAELAWRALAPLAAHTGMSPSGDPPQPYSTLEHAQYLQWRAHLAFVGLDMQTAVRCALEHRGTPPVADDAPKPWLEPREVAEKLDRMAACMEAIVASMKRSDTRQVQPQVIRSLKNAARYCGFSSTFQFREWATRMGFEIPKTKLTKQQRNVFKIDALDKALAHDPLLCRNPRYTDSAL